MARKLLLADDSITIQKVVELVLAEEGFEIKAVNNGEEALAVAGAFKPDIVLADIEMPKINGYQLCETLKNSAATKDIPVILLSGAFEPLDEELARHVKADSFVVKPFESQELISKINASLIQLSEAGAHGSDAEEDTVVAEVVSAEEDLWAMEEVEEVAAAETAAEEVTVEAIMEEAGALAAEAEEISIAEAFEVSEETIIKTEAAIQKEAVVSAVEKERAERIATPVFPEKIKAAEMPLPSKEDLSLMFKKAVDERISVFLSDADIKNALLSSIALSLKDSVEKILWEVAPELTEKLLREMLQSSLASLSKEVEKIIWETVPEVAETMIAKEIEKIKSEI